jgi:hypothetical protein
MSNNTLSDKVSAFINDKLRVEVIKKTVITLQFKLDVDDFLNVISGVLPAEFWEDKMTYEERDDKVKQWFYSLDESQQLGLLQRFSNQLEYIQERGSADDVYRETFEDYKSSEIQDEHQYNWEKLNSCLDRRVEQNDAIMASVENWFDSLPKSSDKTSKA